MNEPHGPLSAAPIHRDMNPADPVLTDVRSAQVDLAAIPTHEPDANPGIEDRPLGPSPLEDRTLSLDDVFKASDVREEDVDVPAWGGKIRIRSLGLDAMRRINAHSAQPDGSTDMLEAMIWMVIEGCVAPKFGPEHRAILGEKGIDVLSLISDKVTSLSGMGEEAVRDAELSFPDAPAPPV